MGKTSNSENCYITTDVKLKERNVCPIELPRLSFVFCGTLWRALKLISIRSLIDEIYIQ